MKKVLMGNHAATIGAVLSRVQVVAAYPITPATQVIELIADMTAKGEYKGKFLRVESEHSAMAALLGASTAGARTFTATSSQGLAYMHELLHWVSGARLPVVMVDVNRALAAPWNLWTDQTDSLSQRDTGWLQFYCATNQEVLDTVIMAYKVSEKLLLPSMIMLDGFTLSHVYEPVDVPDQKAVDAFLPPFAPTTRLDVDNPGAFGSLETPKPYFRIRRRMAVDMDRAEALVEQVGSEFERSFGRGYGAIESYRSQDAEVSLVCSGAVGSTAKQAIDELRAEGHAAGLLRFRLFRPFPTQALKRLSRPDMKLAVVDRNYSPGHQGIFCEEIKAALYGTKGAPEVYGFVAGLGGGDITVELLKEMWHEVKNKTADPVSPLWMEDAR
ncbi:MAG: pyruvate ferredoxin oxidoreductase [Elusimicrobia bacterium RIFOXYD12_FULL_66_9]|nr:MAG: pyruvate ferredoxin oxidoreductase [Elusimicrobia bacterium RIFOXYD12_FULL_66_9]